MIPWTVNVDFANMLQRLDHFSELFMHCRWWTNTIQIRLKAIFPFLPRWMKLKDQRVRPFRKLKMHGFLIQTDFISWWLLKIWEEYYYLRFLLIVFLLVVMMKSWGMFSSLICFNEICEVISLWGSVQRDFWGNKKTFEMK